MNNIFTTAKALTVTVEREHYDDVAIVMLTDKMVKMLNLDGVKDTMNRLYAHKCFAVKVDILNQNSEEYNNKYNAYMFPEDYAATLKLMNQVTAVVHENL